jgi:LuxR family transcriptional regulator, maltose regulon positive regulatory protein
MEAHDVPLVALSAPAGYGKTTAMLEWAAHDPRSFAWVVLGPEDDDPRRLVASIARATAALARGDGDGDRVLIIDDVHHLRSRGASDALTAIADRRPLGAQVVLASRGGPPLRLGRRRGHRALLEMTARDLVMSRAEAAELIELAGVSVGAAELDLLVRRTEGWPAGLYLAALCMGSRPTPDAVARFGGDDRIVADYLADAVLADLSGEQLEFLRRASVLERLTGPLCDAVLGRDGSGAMLRDLARANVLLVPLDRTDTWYRYHRLLAQMFRTELRRRDPDLAAELHRRASRWHVCHDDVDAAIRHAVAAGDAPGAGELMWASALRYLPHGRTATIRRWLDRFTEEQVAACPSLALAAAHSHLCAGERDLAEHWTDAAARAAPGAPASAIGVAAMRAAIARDGVGQMRDDAARAYALAPDDSPWRALACQLEGTARHLQGARGPARRQLEEGARRGVIAAPSVGSLCLAQLSLLALDDGDRVRAAELATRARAQVERFGLAELPTASLVLAASAAADARAGRLESARGDAASAAALLGGLADFAPWYLAEVRIVLARVALRLSDVVAARALLEAAERTVGDDADVPVLGAWLAAAWEQVDAFSAAAPSAPSSLTLAELRVLRMLPTHLSFREMADRLYVSPNTVKTQAQAVYRKLDASSRSEAVARAGALGLLDA